MCLNSMNSVPSLKMSTPYSGMTALLVKHCDAIGVMWANAYGLSLSSCFSRRGEFRTECEGSKGVEAPGSAHIGYDV